MVQEERKNDVISAVQDQLKTEVAGIESNQGFTGEKKISIKITPPKCYSQISFESYKLQFKASREENKRHNCEKTLVLVLFLGALALELLRTLHATDRF